MDSVVRHAAAIIQLNNSPRGLTLQHQQLLTAAIFKTETSAANVERKRRVLWRVVGWNTLYQPP